MIDAAIAEVITYALGGNQNAQYAPATYECLQREATKQQVSILLAVSVMRQERGAVGTQSKNTDLSFDLGPMQVNTIHIEDLERVTNIPAREVFKALKYDPCANIATGLWLLRRSINRSGDLWKGVAQYHSRTPSKGHPYAWNVYNKMNAIVRQMNPEAIQQVLLPGGILAVTYPQNYAGIR